MLEREPTLTLRIDDAPMPGPVAAAALHRRSLPLVARSGERVAIVATATLWRTSRRCRRYALSTAAHVFESGVRVGDLGVACDGQRRIAWLGAMRPSLALHRGADVALIVLGGSAEPERHWQAHDAALLFGDDDGRPGEPAADCHVVAGWPAGQSRWTGRGLSARPVVLFTTPSDQGPNTYRYRRIANRDDGRWVTTPELDGLSGALLWRVCQAGERCALQPAGVQVAFLHGRYVRCEPASALGAMLREL